jgi:hypothetical protein
MDADSHSVFTLSATRRREEEITKLIRETRVNTTMFESDNFIVSRAESRK